MAAKAWAPSPNYVKLKRPFQATDTDDRHDSNEVVI